MGGTARRRAMKDGLGAEAVARLGQALHRGTPSFAIDSFRRAADHGLGQLELKARVTHVRRALAAHLPESYAEALPWVLRAQQNWEPAPQGDPLGGFAAWPLFDWIAHAGQADQSASLAALRRLTSLFTAEFALRPFLLSDPVGVLEVLRGWVDDPDEHVRRLVSEGIRPRLPWAEHLPRFQADPAPVVALLDLLVDDPSLYVRRSVANNLNDISKDHPDHAVAVAQRWLQRDTPERRWIVRHGLRTLIKRGDSGAMVALGFAEAPEVRAELAVVPAQLHLGDSLSIEVHLESLAAVTQQVVVDYAVHFRKASGALVPKVFKLRSFALAPGEIRKLVRRHRFAEISTRRYYDGEHVVELLVCGASVATQRFSLAM